MARFHLVTDAEPARDDAAPSRPPLSIVMPAYDEATGIAVAVRRAAAWLDAQCPDGELWVIDDGSTDQTRAILEQLRPALRALELDGFTRNRGRGAALRLGLQRARGAVVVTTEADLSWGLPVLGRLADLVSSGAADVAIASPHGSSGRMVNVPWPRRALSRGSNALARQLVGSDITMTTGATRAYRRTVLAQILSPLDGKAFHLDTLCRAQRAGLRLREIGATLRWPQAGRARRSLGGGRRLCGEIASHLQVLGYHVYATRLAS